MPFNYAFYSCKFYGITLQVIQKQLLANSWTRYVLIPRFVYLFFWFEQLNATFYYSFIVTEVLISINFKFLSFIHPWNCLHWIQTKNKINFKSHCFSGVPTVVKTNILIRSMGPISELDMVGIYLKLAKK